MSTTDYFPMRPHAVGTIEVEAFGSVICRMARAHSISIYTLAMHLRHWWKRIHPEDDRAKKNVVNATNPMLCGYGANVDTYMSIVASATGCQDLERTTFLSLKAVLEPNGHHVVRADRAWCPACLEEACREGREFYDRLAWALPTTQRCPVHRVRLTTRCPSCQAVQLHYHHLGVMELCCKCKSSLRSDPATWELMPDATLYEREGLDLVARISDGTLHVIPGAYGIFIRSLAEYLSPLGRKISRFAYKAARRPQLAREARNPRLDTLFKRCAALGVNPSDVLSEPEGAARSACLLEFARLDLPAKTKPRRPDELVVLARNRLERELDQDQTELIPSLRQIAREIGVSTGFLNFHFPELIPRFSALRKTNSKRSQQLARELALAYLLGGPIYEFPSAEFSSQDHLVAATVEHTGIGVHAARQAVSVALKERFGWRSYEKYRKQRRRDATLKWPPCD